MIRGTTPTHIWNLPFDASIIKEARVVYAQNDMVVLKKETGDCVIEGNTVKVTLTQEDTLKISHKKDVETQLMVLTHDGKKLETRVISLPVWKVLDDEVMT